MDQAFIAEQKERLLTLQREDQSALQRIEKEMTEGMAENDVKEQEDMATVSTQHATEMAERDVLQMRLDDIDHALDAINNGNYGTCDRCGQPIAQERLEANPAARYCITCQQQIDAEQT